MVEGRDQLLSIFAMKGLFEKDGGVATVVMWSDGDVEGRILLGNFVSTSTLSFTDRKCWSALSALKKRMT